ncbi:CAP domain-containing protein [Sphingopyxis sp.]|uniref:CAP domain-containing protein n=1 Tax=Sphingopyxis sp. TaxID=1908224 RepID=UPI0035ADB156
MRKAGFAAALVGASMLAATASAAPGAFERAVFDQLNHFRADPAGYAGELESYRPRFDGRLLISGGGDEIDIMTNEGVAAVDEAIDDLEGQKPLQRLQWSDLLARAAADHVAAQSRSGAVGHYTNGRGPGERMVARGGGRYVNEVITYGHHSPEGVIDQLLIDDGVPGRGHRFSLLRAERRYAGVACGRHPVHRTMCVIVMAETPDGSPPPPPGRP